MKTNPDPYPDNPAYLTDQIAFVAARCSRLAFERDLAGKPTGSFGPADADETSTTSEQKRRLALLQAGEDTLRAKIDARLAANKEHGPHLGIDQLVADNDLDETERTILILCTMPCLGLDASEPLAACGGFSFSIASPTVQIVAEYLGLDVAGRIALRRVLSDAGALVRGRLVEFERESPEPHNFLSNGIMLTEKAWRVIAGLPSLDEEAATRCEFCGQVVP